MSQFLEDVGDRKAFVAWLGALVAAALALGLAIPVAFASLIERAPSRRSEVSLCAESSSCISCTARCTYVDLTTTMNGIVRRCARQSARSSPACLEQDNIEPLFVFAVRT